MPNPFLCHAHFVDEFAIIYPTLEVTSVGVKRNNFLLERMIFLFPLLVTTRKRKEAAMIPARKEMPELQSQIMKYVVKIDKLFQTLMCLLQALPSNFAHDFVSKAVIVCRYLTVQ